MRTGMDITAATAQPTGVGEYVLQTLRHMLPMLSGEDRLIGWSAGLHRPVGIPDYVSTRHVPVPTRAMYSVWRHTGHPAVDRLLGGVDVFHATNYYLPPTRRARRVLTIYDLVFLVEPRWCSPKVVGPFSANVPRFAREADAVITCSEYSRDEIVRLCGAAPERVHVAYGAPDPRFAPRDRRESEERMRAILGWREPYILTVGTVEPRKNPETLLRAFAATARKHPHRLLFVGGMGWNTEHLPGLIQELGIQDRVTFAGYLPTRDDLVYAYSAADLFVQASHYEGFGLSLTEAMACGCPSIASNASSLPEVGGDAVRYFVTEDDADLARTMDELLCNSGLRASMSEMGRLQAKNYTWGESARRILGVYRSLC